MQLKDTPGLAPFVESLRQNPGDATALLVACDFIDETVTEQDKWFADNVRHLRSVGSVLPAAHREWTAFRDRMKAIDATPFGGDVPVMTRNRSVGQKETAQLACELIKQLAIPCVSVTMAKGSMCFWVNIVAPCNLAREYLYPLTENSGDPGIVAARAENKESMEILEAIFMLAFPNHDDRSDSMTDYYDQRLRFDQKSTGAYHKPNRTVVKKEVK